MGDESPLALDFPFPLDEAPLDEAPFDELPISVATSAARMQAGIAIVVQTCWDSTAIAARSRDMGKGFHGAASPLLTIPLHFMACSTPPCPSNAGTDSAPAPAGVSALRLRGPSGRRSRP